jgi:hypothetical protein
MSVTPHTRDADSFFYDLVYDREAVVRIRNSSATIINTSVLGSTAGNKGLIYVASGGSLAINNVTFPSTGSVVKDVVISDSASRVFAGKELGVYDSQHKSWATPESYARASEESTSLLLEDDPWLVSMRKVRCRSSFSRFALGAVVGIAGRWKAERRLLRA